MQTGPTRALRGFVLSVGDELTSGMTVDTNSAWLSRQLAAEGVQVVGHATVGDDQKAIEEAIRRWIVGHDVLVVTGGLGPTPDDLTREALAEVMEVALVERADWLEHLTEIFRQRRRIMHPGNHKQAMIPETAELLSNPAGTASGIAVDLATGQAGTAGAGDGICRVFVLPGVPAEMIAMFEQHVRPWARQAAAGHGGRVLRLRALHTFGVGESDIAARLGDLLRRRGESEGLQVGTSASEGHVSIRIYAGGATPADAEALLDTVEAEARQKLGELIYGRDGQTLAEAVGVLLRKDPRRPLLRVAESCTGGLLAKRITDIAGASEYFDRGFVTYADEAKTDLLGVAPSEIAAQGAVSEPVVMAMAAGALPAGRPGIALSISGIAGPGGGSAGKPVGTVCIALAATSGGANAKADEPHVFARTFHFPGDRAQIRSRSADTALALLRFHLLGHDLHALPF